MLETSIPVKQTAADIVRARRIIEGPKDLLRSVSQRKYAWTKEMSQAQEDNRWFAGQVNVSRDSIGYATLRKGSKTAYKRSLAFVSNLDAIQCDNLSENLYPHITDPHIQQCIATQIAEEWVHVESYSTLIESVVKGDDLEIYQMYRDVPALGAKNDHVIAQGKAIGDAGSEPFGEKFVKAVCANMVLEGVYFYSGFTTFYAIGKDAQGGINGSVDMIKYIQRDEQDHLWMFKNIWHSLRAERPELFTASVLDACRAMVVDGVERECVWGSYVIEEGVPLLNEKRLHDRVKFLGNEIVKDLLLPEIYKGQTHELQWVDQYDMNKRHNNFFESKGGAYKHSELAFGARKPRAVGGPSSIAAMLSKKQPVATVFGVAH